jgi:fucose 4-O-acetylase-like acetyltransferase
MIRALDAVVARTPATRDRYMDFLRAFSITAVVVGHWTIGIIWWENGLIYLSSAIGATSGLWLATWVLQVMPIFFLVGGFSNLVAYDAFRRRGQSTGAFIRSRIQRLLRPSLVFLSVWVAIQVGLHLADVGRPSGPVIWGETRLLRGMNPPAATLPFGPLWFLGVYLLVVAVSPLTIRMHRRFRWWVPVLLVAGTIVVDVIGFGLGIHRLRYLNIPFVLLLPHQLGHFYADGTLGRIPRKVFWEIAVGGIAALLLLTNAWLFEWVGGEARFRWFPTIGHYPKSILGTDVEPISNAYPPTVCFMLVGLWTISAAMLLRERLTQWLQRIGPWKATIVGNRVIMTLFLWHMTAYLVAIFGLWPLGFGREHDTTARWWMERPLWIVAPGLILAVVVWLVGRYERAAQPRASA